MTISDIAKMAGVSSAAVSRYLNGGPLSEQKRAVIHEVVEKTGYRPDTAAQEVIDQDLFVLAEDWDEDLLLPVVQRAEALCSQ